MRMRGSRISVFCAVYSISLSDLSLRLVSTPRPAMCDTHSRPSTAVECEQQNGTCRVKFCEKDWTDTRVRRNIAADLAVSAVISGHRRLPLCLCAVVDFEMAIAILAS